MIIHAKFGDPSLNGLGAVAFGVKKIMADFAGLGRWRPLSKFSFTPLDSSIFFQSKCENDKGLALLV